jgi:hypothetical protein
VPDAFAVYDQQQRHLWVTGNSQGVQDVPEITFLGLEF